MDKPTDNQVAVETGRLRGMIFYGGDRAALRDAAIRELTYGIDKDDLDSMTAAEREMVMTARQWKAGKCETKPSAELLR